MHDFGAYVSIVGFDQFFDNGQTDPCSPMFSGTGFFGPVKSLEEEGKICFVNFSTISRDFFPKKGRYSVAQIGLIKKCGSGILFVWRCPCQCPEAKAMSPAMAGQHRRGKSLTKDGNWGPQREAGSIFRAYPGKNPA